jgi:hypothetical protein
MRRKTKRSVLLMFALVLLLSLPQGIVAAGETKNVYEVTYSSEDLSTPMDWYNSDYFDNPLYKENRFVQYWVQTPIAPGGPRDTGFYMVYNEEGLNIFFQSNESERTEDGALKSSAIELFMQTGQGDLPYHQMIIHMDGSSHEYYEWQTENRDNRPFKDFVSVTNEEIPTGWGTVLFIPWEAVYDYVPLDGEKWEFSMIRWSPSNSPTWGGNVHQPGRFHELKFAVPTSEQRTLIQKNMIVKAWEKFGSTAVEVTAVWQTNGDAADRQFFNAHVQPLIAAGEANGSPIPNLDSLSPSEIDELWDHVESLTELRYDVEDERKAYLKKLLMRENEAPTVENSTHTTYVNTPVSGIVAGTDADGDALTYALGAAPAQGTTTVDADGNWTYTPNEDYIGSDQFTVIVTDPSGDTATSTIDLIVKAAPVISVVLDKTELSPPNHKMVPIEATITHSDGPSAISSFELVSITSNEEDNGSGDGNTSNDIQDADFGTADTSFSLRAERSGSGNGRIYTVIYSVVDHEGYTTTVSAEVKVPKGKGNS